MNLLLNAISVISTFIVLEGLIYFSLQTTVGRLKPLKQFAYKEVLFLLIGAVLILLFFDFYLPH